MASLGLSALATSEGFAIFGSTFLGHLLATGAGLAIDSLFLNQVLGGQEPSEGQRVNDLQIQDAREGAPANRLFGKRVRVAGTIVWMPAVREIKDKQKGGKGGSNASFIVYRTFGHVAIEFGRTFGVPVLDVPRLWANGKLLFNAGADLDVTSTKIRAEIDLYGGVRKYFLRLISDEAGGGPDLSEFIAGKAITVSGFVDGVHTLISSLEVSGFQTAILEPNKFEEGRLTLVSSLAGALLTGDSFTIQNDSTSTEYTVTEGATFAGSGDVQTILILPPIQENVGNLDDIQSLTHNATKNNVTSTVVSSGRDDKADESYVVIQRAGVGGGIPWQELFVFGGDAAGDSVRLEQELPSFSRTAAKAIRFHLGSDDQVADQLIKDYEENEVGGGNVPGLINRVVGVIEDMEFTDFGFLPQIEAEVMVGDSGLVSDVIKKYWTQDVGRSEGEIDVSGLGTTAIEGYIVRGVVEGKKALQPPSIVGHITGREDGEKIIFDDLTSVTFGTINPAHLGAVVQGDRQNTQRVPFQHKPADDLKVIDELWVNFKDPDKDYVRGSVPARGPGNVRDRDTLNVDVALTRAQATSLADATLDLSQIAASRVRFTLPPRYFATVKAGTGWNLGTHFGRSWDILVEKVEIGANYLVVCEGREFDIDAFVQSKVPSALP